ncbi:hypothetical protein TVNIR_2223 [Thioalkalivibrio nitratireducens DSM 14787]|uniref:Uncharacterized protein n=1 Tax=Thioalkalivibrio nitratireducens (strain DSM 14787 / UNIQEM 213 / ALEN2) TaxID=1255043 RepID=L0DWC5_THIND|nr:hypothetical protein TVNIR_2223 [Thioalkalivibrio nitratireducens DSM 14787]
MRAAARLADAMRDPLDRRASGREGDDPHGIGAGGASMASSVKG